jgi:2-polyprenyl-3-methyl-5-hydroxy-6-metoxy-1,4-benzoquinol methylase
MPNPPSPQIVFETFNAFQRTEALKTALELGLFTAIGAGNDTPQALASVCGIAERGARILADYLTVIGFLQKSDGRYQLSPEASAFLDQNSPAYLGGAAEFMCSEQHRGRFQRLTQAVQTGGAKEDDESVLAPESDVWVRFARGMAGMMAMPAELLAQRVLQGETSAMQILDIAAGHGLFGIAFARQNPNAEVTAVDWANVLAVAEQNANQAGVAERHRLLPGSAFDVEFGEGYDVVLLTNFLHHFDAAANEAILRKVHAALKPGGRAVALEFVPDDSRVAPTDSAAFALIMLATTPAGDAYTFREYDAMFQAAGFQRSECFALEPTMQHVVIGHRSA